MSWCVEAWSVIGQLVEDLGRISAVLTIGCTCYSRGVAVRGLDGRVEWLWQVVEEGEGGVAFRRRYL